MIELDETYASLRQPSGEQTIGRKGSSGTALFAVQLKRPRRLVRQIGQLRHRSLHTIGHFVLCDPGFDLRIAVELELLPVQLVDTLVARWQEPRAPEPCVERVSRARRATA